MQNIITSGLCKVGLYRPIKKLARYLTDTQYRRNDFEIRADIRRTRREVGHWAAQGETYADPRRLFAIVSFTNLPMHAKFHSLVAKTMQLRGYTPLIFTNSGSRFGHEYFRLFGIDQLVMWNEFALEASTKFDVKAIAEELSPSPDNIQGIVNLRFHGVDIGKHALSVTARRMAQGRLDLINPDTWQLFFTQFSRAVESVLTAEELLDKYPIQKMLVRDPGYIPNGAIYEAALKRGVDCIVYEQGQRRHNWIFKRYNSETKGQHYFSLSDESWGKIKKEPWTQKDDEELKAEFNGRYMPDSMDDTRRLMSGKTINTPEEVNRILQLDPEKKTAVIFSHISWDAAFFYGTCLFDDFDTWLFETVKFVSAESPNLNWIVKLHPFNAFKLQRESISEESEMGMLRKLMPFPDHLKIIRADTNINTQSLFPIVDYVVTVNGTVGMEFPCFGIPAVLAGTGRYDGHGFTIDPRTKEEYFSTLRYLQNIPNLDERTQQLARQHFYTLVTNRQFSLEDIAPMELKRLNEAQSNVHDNISILSGSLEEFSSAPSIQKLGTWLADSHDLDLLS